MRSCPFHARVAVADRIQGQATPHLAAARKRVGRGFASLVRDERDSALGLLGDIQRVRGAQGSIPAYAGGLTGLRAGNCP